MSAATLKPLNRKRLRTRSHRKTGPKFLTKRIESPLAESIPEEFQRPIPFVPHPAFERGHPERQLRRLAPLPELSAALPPDLKPGLTFVAGFVSQPLLSAGEEESLFAWMNFHRYRAEQLRRRAVAAKRKQPLFDQIRVELAQANRLRNHIVSSNLRLVVSLGRKFARSLDHLSELISEGVLPLIRSVELFDISLGNRFSTYATWAVRNQMLRAIKRAATSVASPATDLLFESLPAPPAEPASDPTAIAPALQVERLLAGLPDRDRIVLRARFGLDGEPTGQSLSDVAVRVGLSKERVRQIVLKSLEEIRQQFADQLEPV